MIRALGATGVEVPMKHVLGASRAAIRAPLLLIDLEIEESVTSGRRLVSSDRDRSAGSAARRWPGHEIESPEPLLQFEASSSLAPRAVDLSNGRGRVGHRQERCRLGAASTC
jgi:hypothetical protein